MGCEVNREPRRDITRPLWLFLLREGGYWDARELAQRLTIDATQARSTLRQMWDRGMVKRQVPTAYGKTITYTVDDDCRLPDNLTLREVRNA